MWTVWAGLKLDRYWVRYDEKCIASKSRKLIAKLDQLVYGHRPPLYCTYSSPNSQLMVRSSYWLYPWCKQAKLGSYWADIEWDMMTNTWASESCQLRAKFTNLCTPIDRSSIAFTTAPPCSQCYSRLLFYIPDVNSLRWVEIGQILSEILSQTCGIKVMSTESKIQQPVYGHWPPFCRTYSSPTSQQIQPSKDIVE